MVRNRIAIYGLAMVCIILIILISTGYMTEGSAKETSVLRVIATVIRCEDDLVVIQDKYNYSSRMFASAPTEYTLYIEEHPPLSLLEVGDECEFDLHLTRKSNEIFEKYVVVSYESTDSVPLAEASTEELQPATK